MKKITIIIYAILCALLAFLSSCTEKESQVEVSSVSLNTATIEMVEGETFNLVATVLPKDAEYDGITWASSNASVASVNSGTVTALKEGTATITASAGGKSSTCSVKVSSKVIPVTSVTLDKTSLSMQVGETETLTATVNPADATDKNVTWSSSDVSVATVADGKITAKKSGTATITAKSGNYTAECVVSVSVNTESVTLDKTTLSLAVGESAQLTATISPADATDKNVTWTSSDESVAKVADGKVTAVKSGKAVITAKCGDKTAECAVTVIVPVASLSLDKASVSLALGETVQLTATIEPNDATDKNVIWSSSDESVLTVENGMVKSIKFGSAIVTATVNTFSASCNVSVIHPDNVIYYISNDGNMVQPFNEPAFGAKIVSNDYSDDLGKIVFDAPLKSIGKAAFYNCRNLKSVVVPDKVTEIGASAFKKSHLLQINIPQSVVIIGESAFEDTYLNYLVLPDSMKSIGASAFSGCRDLKTINKIPAGLTKIEKMIFSDCVILESPIVIPESVKSIGASAFFYCEKIPEIVLPERMDSIGYRAFQHTPSARKVRMPKSASFIGNNAFYNCGMINLEVPNGLSEISEGCFEFCFSLSSVVIPEGVRYISKEAFDCCRELKSVILPSTMSSLGAKAFDRCDMLSELYIKAAVPPTPNIIAGSTVIESMLDVNIYVPRTSVDAYKEKWSKYKDNIKGYDF